MFLRPYILSQKLDGVTEQKNIKFVVVTEPKTESESVFIVDDVSIDDGASSLSLANLGFNVELFPLHALVYAVEFDEVPTSIVISKNSLGIPASKDEGDSIDEASQENWQGLIALGSHWSNPDAHSCAIVNRGKVMCWGANDQGQLGLGHTDKVGYIESPAKAGFVDVGGEAVKIGLGTRFGCVLLADGNVRCWGDASQAALGYGDTNNVGDNETPASKGNIQIGGKAIDIAVGEVHVCVLLDTYQVRCWGNNAYYGLGNGSNVSIGDDELPTAIAPIDIGESLVKLTAGAHSSCIINESGQVKCWGHAQHGELGYPGVSQNTLPKDVNYISIGAKVASLSHGHNHLCAVSFGGELRCWGRGTGGALGYGNEHAIGDTEHPSAAGVVKVGAKVRQVYAAGSFTCVITESEDLKCWGDGTYGRTGHGIVDFTGDDELPDSIENVSIGFKVKTLGISRRHVCAVSAEGKVRCFGWGESGALGHGNIYNIGDDELPSSVDVVDLGATIVPRIGNSWKPQE